MEERPKEETKKKHKKKKDPKEAEQSSVPEVKAGGRAGKKLKAEDQIYQAMLADYQRKQRKLQKPQSPSSSSSDSSEEEDRQQNAGYYYHLY